jgi:hypothetical protein
MTSHPITRPTCQPREGGGSRRGLRGRWWGREEVGAGGDRAGGGGAVKDS